MKYNILVGVQLIIAIILTIGAGSSGNPVWDKFAICFAWTVFGFGCGTTLMRSYRR